jgi:mono/diheme cytochrome c family protein
MNRAGQVALVVLLGSLGAACGASRQPMEPSTASEVEQDPIEGDRIAYQRAQPVFQEHCSRCHTSEGKRAGKGALEHFNMDTYPLGGHHAAEISVAIREVLGMVGGDPSMPKDDPGAVQGEQLALVIAWADAFDRANDTGVQQGVAAEGQAGSGHGRHDHAH